MVIFVYVEMDQDTKRRHDPYIKIPTKRASIMDKFELE
jgi:hypothetical protein